MKRLVNRTSQSLIDLLVLSLAFWAAFFIRFEGDLPFDLWKRLMFTWPYVVGFQYSVLVAFGVTRFAWRYVGLREAYYILAATSASTAALLGVRLVAGQVMPKFGWALYAIVPIGVILIDYLLAFLGIAGARGLRRLAAEKVESGRRRDTSSVGIPTLLIGAGEAGVMVAKEIGARPDLGIKPVGFIDDDARTHGTVVHGIRVLGPSSELAAIAARQSATQALITMASAVGRDIRRIHDLCERTNLAVKIVPGIFEIVGGKVNLSHIRKVAIDDLLRREPVVLDDELIAEGLRGRVVLVTGAGGSIGSELCRQICRFAPARLVMLEQAENGLFEIHRELRRSFPKISLIPCVADVCDSRRIEAVFAANKPAYVFHAAAHKHVPMMEWNPGEAVKNNIFGTRTVADAAHQFNVDRFVLISTDKAVNPTSVMGATKRAAEIYVQARSQQSKTRFVAVRFGNVLGSTGSVVPIFKEQIAAGGPVTVTHPDMKRYFMTIPEACQLVLQAGAMGEGGEIFVLDMGEPVRVVDLARDLIRLSGLRPEEDIDIVFTGVRPGEKLFEELSVEAESAARTKHPKILIGHLTPHPLAEVEVGLKRLHQIISSESDEGRVLHGLQSFVPEYHPEQQTPASAGVAPSILGAQPVLETVS